MIEGLVDDDDGDIASGDEDMLDPKGKRQATKVSERPDRPSQRNIAGLSFCNKDLIDLLH